MADVMSLATQFLNWAQSIAMTWGYIGIFLVSLVGNATIIFPIPSFLIVFAFGGILNPWLVGVAAGAGAALGELTGYALGMGGREVIEKKYEKWLSRAKKWIETHGAFPIIILFAATPLPDDIIGIFSGVIRYSIKKFLAACFMGKLIMNIALAWAGYYGSWLLGGSGVVFSIVIVVLIVVVIYNILYKVMKEKGWI